MRPTQCKYLNKVKIKQKYMKIELIVYGIETKHCHSYWSPKDVSCNSAYRLRYWNWHFGKSCAKVVIVATALTVYGMRRRVWGIRGEKRRWGPHIASTWTKWRKNESDKGIVLIVYGIETTFLWVDSLHRNSYRCNSTYRLRYWNNTGCTPVIEVEVKLQQYLPFMACAAECEIAEE